MTYGREKNERNGWDGYLSTVRLLFAPSCRNTLVLCAYGSTVDNLVGKKDTPRVCMGSKRTFRILTPKINRLNKGGILGQENVFAAIVRGGFMAPKAQDMTSIEASQRNCSTSFIFILP